jgi:hypothetical protein
VSKRLSFWYAGLGMMRITLLPESIAFGQEIGSTSREADRTVATVVEVMVTGSNIPTAEGSAQTQLIRIDRQTSKD